MDRIERVKGLRRLAAPLIGALAIVALAAAPAFAHAQISTADPSRHILLAAELATADATETADLETLLDVQDAQDNSQTDATDQGGTDATDPSGTDATDQSGTQDQSGTDATDPSGADGADPASTGADASGGGSDSGSGSNSGSDSGN